MEQKKYIITDELRQALIKYLSARPYSEVFAAVPMLQQLPELEKEDKEISHEAASQNGGVMNVGVAVSCP